VAVLAAGGVAAATIPAGDGTITGCYSTTDGALRVIDAGAGATCPAGENKLTWGQQGPPGPAGPSGPAAVFGGTDFIDAADTTGYISLGGGQLAPSSATGGAPLPLGGTLRGLRVTASPDAPSGKITFGVRRNGTVTPVGCTITAPATSCTDVTDTQTFSAGERLSVYVTNATGGAVRYARWTARYP
jgi:hypothetical protein